jgi:Na+-driven multidrug efflux pump
LLLLKLQAAEKGAKASSSVVKIFVVSLLAFFISIIITFLAGYYLSQLTNSYLIGFALLAVFYFVLILLFLYFYKRSWDKKITDKMVAFFFNQKEE